MKAYLSAALLLAALGLAACADTKAAFYESEWHQFTPAVKAEHAKAGATVTLGDGRTVAASSLPIGKGY